MPKEDVMTNPSKLDEIEARASKATEGPWRALGTGASGGDHWYICDRDEAIASISCQDGINEDQREPDAVFIAHAREDVPRLLVALRAVEAFCATSEQHAAEYGDTASVYVDDVRAAIREALEK